MRPAGQEEDGDEGGGGTDVRSREPVFAHFARSRCGVKGRAPLVTLLHCFIGLKMAASQSQVRQNDGRKSTCEFFCYVNWYAC